VTASLSMVASPPKVRAMQLTAGVIGLVCLDFDVAHGGLAEVGAAFV
jgi:hypothetical protein